MKYSSFKKDQLIFENWRKFTKGNKLYEAYSKDELAKMSPEDLKRLIGDLEAEGGDRAGDAMYGDKGTSMGGARTPHPAGALGQLKKELESRKERGEAGGFDFSDTEEGTAQYMKDTMTGMGRSMMDTAAKERAAKEEEARQKKIGTAGRSTERLDKERNRMIKALTQKMEKIFGDQATVQKYMDKQGKVADLLQGVNLHAFAPHSMLKTPEAQQKAIDALSAALNKMHVAKQEDDKISESKLRRPNRKKGMLTENSKKRRITYKRKTK